MRQSIFLLLLTVTWYPAHSLEADESAEGSMDLDRVVSLALTRNPGFQAEMARRTEVDGGVTEAGADAWPQVELVGSWNRSRNPSLLNSPDFEDIIEQFPDFEPGEQELWSLAVQVEQTVYSGGKVRAAVDLAELVVDITEAQIHIARLDLALAAAESYYTLLRAHDALESLESQRRAREEALKVVQDRFELGEATELERLRAVSAVAQVAPAVAEAEGAVRAGESRLRALLGLPPGAAMELLSPEPSPSTFDAPGVQRLIGLADLHRPELKDIDLQRESLDRQKVVTRADGRPQLDLTGAYGRQVRLLDDLEDNLFADWRVSLGVSWKLFDGGRRKGQLAQLESQEDQLHHRRRELMQTITYDIERSLADLNTALARKDAADIAARAAEEAARVAGETYRLGLSLQADLLDAQDEAIQQELDAGAAFFDSLIELARLRRAVGLLPGSPWNSPPATTTQQEPAP